MSNAIKCRRYRIRKMLKEQYLTNPNEMIEEIIENLVDDYINLYHIQKAIDENGVTQLDRYGTLIPSKLLDSRKNIQSTIKNQTEMLQRLTMSKEDNSDLFGGGFNWLK